MKPLRMTLEWFGPYTFHTVDLAVFHGEGLFLVHGDTGSGKSTLLDALTWVFYGRGLGSRSTDEHLRNKSASPEDVTRVSLDFALGTSRYRLVRAMAFSRPARRGGGVTTQKAEASLASLDEGSSFAPVASPRAVNEAVEKLLGLKYEQFVRVIVLPQGEFRALLLAPADEQERLLEHIFGTARFEQIETRLRKMATESEAQLSGQRRAVEALLLSVGAASVDALDGMVGEVGDALTEAKRAHDEAHEALAKARTETESLRLRAERNGRRARLHDEEAKLIEAAPAMAAMQRELDGARAASRAKPFLEASEETLTRASNAVEQRDRAEAALREAEGRLHDPSLSEDEEQSHRDRLDVHAEALTTLEALGAVADDLKARKTTVATFERALTKAQADHEAALKETAVVRAESEARKRESETLQNELRKEATASRAVQNLEQRKDALTVRATTARRLEESQRSVDDAERRVKATTRSRDEARAERDAARQRERAQLAARLAAHLQDGEACPVCGAHEHPAPAKPDRAAALGVTLDDLEAAFDRAQETLTRALQERDQRVGEREATRKALDEMVSTDGATEAQLTELLTAAKTELEQHRLRRSRIQLLERDQQRAAPALTRATEAVTKAEQEVLRVRAHLEVHAPEIERLSSRLAEAGVTADGVGVARDEARTAMRVEEQALKVIHAERLKRASAVEIARSRAGVLIEACREAQRDADRARAQRDESMAAEGFVDEAELRLALRSSVRCEDLEEALAGHRQAVDRIRAAVDALGPAEAAVSWDDLAQAEAALHASTATQHEAARTVGTLQERRAQLDRVASEAARSGASTREAEARAAVVSRVSDVVNGHNEARIRLGRFVLLEQFDRVVTCASARFESMSDGRFRLRRRPSRERGREFELAVDDAFTGNLERPVATLSGGEMFTASLAMALGLGDVLQAWAGGVRVESLFVDEGFGSLDEESLDKAVAVLERLPEHARLVGVVSHVAEMRKRIPARLEVLRTESGSVTHPSVRLRRTASERVEG